MRQIECFFLKKIILTKQKIIYNSKIKVKKFNCPEISPFFGQHVIEFYYTDRDVWISK
jgi:hypothetical protein